jgi:hypothetical protein
MAKKITQPFSILDGKDVELISTKGNLAFMKIMEYSQAVSVLAGNHPTIKKKNGWVYKIYQLGGSQFKDVQKI